MHQPPVGIQNPDAFRERRRNGKRLSLEHAGRLTEDHLGLAQQPTTGHAPDIPEIRHEKERSIDKEQQKDEPHELQRDAGGDVPKIRSVVHHRSAGTR